MFHLNCIWQQWSKVTSNFFIMITCVLFFQIGLQECGQGLVRVVHVVLGNLVDDKVEQDPRNVVWARVLDQSFDGRIDFESLLEFTEHVRVERILQIFYHETSSLKSQGSDGGIDMNQSHGFQSLYQNENHKKCNYLHMYKVGVQSCCWSCSPPAAEYALIVNLQF